MIILQEKQGKKPLTENEIKEMEEKLTEKTKQKVVIISSDFDIIQV